MRKVRENDPSLYQNKNEIVDEWTPRIEVETPRIEVETPRIEIESP